MEIRRISNFTAPFLVVPLETDEKASGAMVLSFLPRL
jgi:hypothetical protein